MRIYKVRPDWDNYANLQVEGEISFDGRLYAESWHARVLSRIEGNESVADCVAAGCLGGFYLSATAVEALRVHMGRFEALPMKAEFGAYFAINPLDILDALDHAAADLSYFSSTTKTPDAPRRIRSISRFAFRADRLAGYHLFKLIDLPLSYIFCDEVFVEAVHRLGITGFAFRQVWESHPKPRTLFALIDDVAAQEDVCFGERYISRQGMEQLIEQINSGVILTELHLLPILCDPVSGAQYPLRDYAFSLTPAPILRPQTVDYPSWSALPQELLIYLKPQVYIPINTPSRKFASLLYTYLRVMDHMRFPLLRQQIGEVERCQLFFQLS